MSRPSAVVLSRRDLLAGASALVFAPLGSATAAAKSPRTLAEPVPLGAVRLKPSIWADAERANRAYLLSLSPDRLLHKFRKYAGLEPKGAVYGGWESQQIAGHTLGHYLTACSLSVANTGDPRLRERLAYTVSELARIQRTRGDGYLGGIDTERGGKVVDGKAAFEEVRRGDIRPVPWRLNDTWVPLYTYHKVHAGLLDAHRHAQIPGALEVALGMADYLGTIVEGLTDDQVQKVLVCEFGGLNDSYAETYALTGDQRWLRIARKLRHRAVLDPLAAREDRLSGLHANTQIPKVIGLARLYELTGDKSEAVAAAFFHETVTRRHSYVIGGNSDREHFSGPGEIASHVTETTCEACNTYNMLKLTRHLYAWEPRTAWFDVYERAHLNHIMAHQRPDTGQFVYFMPLSAGARRSYSTAEESFWCCVGTGMESHAKHAESIFWRRGETLFVNLFIPSRLDLPDQDLALDLDTRFPADGKVTLAVDRAPARPVEVALRLPGWTRDPGLRLNGTAVPLRTRDGYAVLKRRWRRGDRLELDLPMRLTAEPTPDDPSVVAFLSGPLVLAADLGPAERPFEVLGPALLNTGDPTRLLRPVGQTAHEYLTPTAYSGELRLRPFFGQYDRRTAVYMPTFTAERWAAEGPGFLARERERVDIAARTVDTIYLGEQQPEQDHDFRASSSEPFQLNGRSGRRIPNGHSAAMKLSRRDGSMMLRLTYWGQDTHRPVVISVDGRQIAQDLRQGASIPEFVTVDYPMPPGPAGPVEVRFEAPGQDAIIYEARIMSAPPKP
jgi:hypothetical protein